MLLLTVGVCWTGEVVVPSGGCCGESRRPALGSTDCGNTQEEKWKRLRWWGDSQRGSVRFFSCKAQQLLFADFGPLGLSGVVHLTTRSTVWCWCFKILLKLAHLLLSASLGNACARNNCVCVQEDCRAEVPELYCALWL